MASPTWRSQALGGGSSAANVTVSVPAGTVNGDVMLFFLAKDATGAVTNTTGWTLIYEGTANSDYAGLWYRRASSEPANYTFNFASVWRNAIIVTYQGVVATGSPLDPDPPAAWVEVASATTGSTGSNTTLTADTVVIAFHKFRSATSWSSTSPSGWTIRQNAANNEVHVMDQAFVGPASTTTATGATPAAQAATGSAGPMKSIVVELASVTAGSSLSGGPTLLGPSVTGTVTDSFVLSGGTTLSNVVVSGVLAETFVLSGGAVLVPLQVAGVLSIPGFALSGGPTLAGPAVSGTLVETFTLSGGPTLTRLAVAGSVASVYTLSGGPTLTRLSLAGGLVEAFSVASGPTLAKVVVGGVLSTGFVLSGGVILPRLGVGGALTASVPPAVLSGGPTLLGVVINGILYVVPGVTFHPEGQWVRTGLLQSTLARQGIQSAVVRTNVLKSIYEGRE